MIWRSESVTPQIVTRANFAIKACNLFLGSGERACLKAAGLGDGSDPGHPLEYRRRRRGGHFLRPGAARTWVDEAEDGLDATKTDVSVCWGVSQSHATQLDAASNAEQHPASARLDSRRPANVRPSPVIFPASASTTNQRIHAQEF